MNTHQGFSLTEVLISLFLITSSTLGLFTQQWKTSQLFNQATLTSLSLIDSDNHAEHFLMRVQAVNVSGS